MILGYACQGRSVLAKNLSEWRKLVLEKDNYTCKICGNTASIADHIVSRTRNPSLTLETNNGRCLCLPHHGTHGDRVYRPTTDKVVNGVLMGVRHVFRMGGSLMVLLPTQWAREHGLKEGDDLPYAANHIIKYIPMPEEKYESEKPR